MMENRTLTLAPYLALARDLTALIVPVRPRPAFRAHLEDSLLEAARRQRALEQLAISPATETSSANTTWAWRDLLGENLDRRWMLGAAAVGSAVSVAGVLAYFWRQRERRAA